MARPSAFEVAWRALCLREIWVRGFLEYPFVCGVDGSRIPIPPGMNEPVHERNASLKAAGIWDRLSSSEESLMRKAVGQWSPQDCTNAAWRAEALGVLVWALGLADSIGPYDSGKPKVATVEALPSDRPVGEFITGSHLREGSEISKARDAAELWHWRARTSALQKSPERIGQLPRGYTLERIIKEAAKQAERHHLLRRIRDDFPAFGGPYRNATSEQLILLTSIAQERHYALNWLCGYADNWDKVPTDT